MSVAAREILNRLADLGAEVERRGDALVLRAGTAPVPRALVATVKEHKTEVLRALFAGTRQVDQEVGAAHNTDRKTLALAWTEGLMRLDPDRPLGDVPHNRWMQLVSDLRIFVDGPFCAVASALGWTPHDLVGCDPSRPFARIDRAGLIWLLHGSVLIAMSENTATIEMPTGARQTYRRKPAARGRVLAWGLK